jgi:hypothetical protein
MNTIGHTTHMLETEPSRSERRIASKRRLPDVGPAPRPRPAARIPAVRTAPARRRMPDVGPSRGALHRTQGPR